MMNNSFLIAGSMYLGWILSPEALVLSSNYAGRGGMYAIVALLLVLLVVSLWLIVTRPQATVGTDSPITHFTQTSKDLAVTSSLAIFIPTGILVTAGFTFNETFLYWFPNFGFSAALLGIITTGHLIGAKAVHLLQKLFVASGLISLFIIIIAGLLTQSDISQEALQTSTASGTTSQILPLIGGGLLFYLGLQQLIERRSSPKQTVFIIGFAALLLALWQFVALKHVPQAKLAESTIPYILVGREILGQTGRILIGITIIAGTCAATNYFISLATSKVSALIVNLSPLSTARELLIRRASSLIFAGAIGFCMASGLAGEPHLELYIYGTLLLWLLSTGIQIGITSFLKQQLSTTQKITSGITVALFSTSFLYLIGDHHETASLIIFITLVLGSSSLLSLPVLLKGKSYIPQQTQQGDVQ